MKRFSEQLKKQSDSIRLRAPERAELRDRLTTYLEYHPLPAEMRAKQAPTKPAAETLESQPFTTLSFNWSMIRGAMASMAVITLVAVPMVAERTAPGDVLYPVKVEFNEELRSKLALSPYQKIEWETTRLERRIAEARVLASEGKLTEEVEAEVAAAVKEQSQKTKAEINKLRSTNQDDAAIADIEFASMLAVQSEMIENTVSNQSEEATVASADSEVKSGSVLASVVAEESADAEASGANAKPSYEKLVARVETETTRAQELFDSVKEYASEEEVVSIERRLEDVDRKVNAAATLMNPAPVEEIAEATESANEDEGESLVEDVSSTTEEENVIDEAEMSVADETASPTPVTTTAAEESGEQVDANNTETTDAAAEPVVEEKVVEEVPASPIATETDRDAAQVFMREALTDIRKLISFMSSIDVRENVSIDQLVPVTPTTDERLNSLKRQLDELEEAETRLGRALVEIDVSEKVELAFADLSANLAVAQTMFNDDAVASLDALESQVSEMSALVADIERLVTSSNIEEGESSTGESDEADGEGQADAESAPDESVGTSTAELLTPATTTTATSAPDTSQ